MPTYPIQLKRNGTAAATPSSLLHGEVALNYADGKLFWKDASNVIQSFTFQAYALSSHTHAASDITSGTLDAARLPLATTGAAGAVIVGTGLGVSSGTVSVTYGTTSGTACQGNDSRLSDTRTPTDGSVTTAKIANDAVTYAKIQNVSATDRLLGRSSAGAGDVEEITCTAFGRSLIDDADAAAARSTLSVQPTASPAFTGAATFANTGNVVPLTVTNTGTANSFVIADQSGDPSPFVVDASGNVGIGTSLPLASLDVYGADATVYIGTSSYGRLITSGGNSLGHLYGSFAALSDGIHLTYNHYHNAAGTAFVVNSGGGTSRISVGYSSISFAIGGVNTAPSERVAINSSGQLLVTAGSASACGVAFSGDPDTGIAQLSAAGANTLSICTNSAERVRVGSGGNVAIGAIDPQTALHIDKNADGALVILRGAQTANTQHILFRNPFHTNNGSAGTAFVGAQDTGSSGGNLIFATTANGSGASGTPTERMRVDASGMVLCASGFALQGEARPSSGAGLEVNYVAASNAATVGAYDRTGNAYKELHLFGSVIDFQIGAGSDMRLDANGYLLVGYTASNGAYRLQVNSQIYATNATVATSDARFKTHIESLTDATAVIEALRPVAFDFIPHAERNFAAERQVGLIAQEAQSALAGTDYADSVVAQCGDHLGLAYEKLVPVLIRALQETNARIAALEERLNHA